MSRRVLSILVIVGGLACALGAGIFTYLAPTALADAHTAPRGGPGVDVFLRTPFIEAGDDLVLDVVARGADAVGLATVDVQAGTQLLGHFDGIAATALPPSAGRTDTAPMVLSVPATMHPGDSLFLLVRVDYLVAATAGSPSTRHSESVSLEVPIYDDFGRLIARAMWLGLAAGALVVWIWIGHQLAALYARVRAREPHTRMTAIEAIGLVVGYLGAGLGGYWLFAVRLMPVFDLHGVLWAIALVALWLVAPLWWIRLWRARQRRHRPLPRAIAQ